MGRGIYQVKVERSDSDTEMSDDHVAFLADAVTRVADPDERAKLQAMFDGCSGDDEKDQKLRLDFMEAVHVALERQVPNRVKKTAGMKRRERQRRQEARGDLGPITKHGVPRSELQLMGTNPGTGITKKGGVCSLESAS